jgi:ATP-dependent helicase/nuclease subunit A
MTLASDAQTRAIHTHDRDVIVIAGAGSGKTYVLVERYAALLETHAVSEIVAITFTNKAAREMRERVRLRLDEKWAAAADEAERARWSERIGALDSARIMTIHALCTALLRANAAEARVDPDFAVLEESDSRLLREDALDLALKQLAAEDDPALALFDEYSAPMLRKALLDGMTGDPLNLEGDLREQWDRLWSQVASRELRRLRGSKAVAALEEAGFVPETDKLGAIWLQTRTQLHSALDAPTLADAVALLGEIDINLRVGSAPAWGGKAALDEAKAILRFVRAEIEALLERAGQPPNTPGDQRAADLLPLWKRALDRARGVYESAKRDRAALDFDDLERIARDLLRDEDVRARWRAEFAHLLVDEFQDTNRAQWDIITALARPGGLFLVGDPKQSIYAFRGADVTVFEAARRAIEAAGGEVISLSHSYRTHSELVRRFNTLFSRVLVREDEDALYQVEFGEPMTAQRPYESGLPPTEIRVGVYPSRGGGEDDRSSARRYREGRQIAAWIVKQVESARPIYDKALKAYRPIEYGDIAILLRRMTHVTAYEAALKDAGLPFVTLAGRGYFDRQEVWDVLNLLRALHAPGDSLALASALKSPLFNLTDDHLLRLASQPGLTMWSALIQDQSAEMRFVIDMLRTLRERAGRVTIYELMAEALAHTGYLATLTALPDGARRRANVEKLLDRARDSGHVTLGAFSRYLADLSALEVREGEAALDAEGAIRLMTIHASKGLEFPAVVLADQGGNSGRNDNSLLHIEPPSCRVYDPEQDNVIAPPSLMLAQRHDADREEAESRRLFYVAATRAADVLLISGLAAQKNDGDITYDGTLAWWIDTFGEPSDDERYDATIDPAAVRSVGEHSASLIVNGEGVPPPLIAPVSAPLTTFVRTLSASQIADLGCAFNAESEEQRRYYRERWRNDVLRAAPSSVEPVQDAGRRVTKRIIGEMVHRALRWWTPSLSSVEVSRALETHAWELGIIDGRARDSAVQEALSLFEQVLSADVQQRIRRAMGLGNPVFRELPFIYRAEKREIHGVIDVLFQTVEGRWQVVDYKTADLRHYPQSARHHARRYWLQVGVYAAAAMQVLAEANFANPVPEVYIHYIRGMDTVKVETHEWQDALTRLEPCIGGLIKDDE